MDGWVVHILILVIFGKLVYVQGKNDFERLDHG